VLFPKRSRRFTLPVLLTFAVSLCGVGVAQNQQDRVPPPSPSSSVRFEAPGLERLPLEPSSQTAFTFDRSMIQMADSWLASNSPDAHAVVAGLNSITVRNFRFRQPTDYDPGVMQNIVSSYRAAGWKHLVNANAKDSGGTTDLWIHFRGSEIDNLAVLTRASRNMSFISVDCILRPLDLLHLSGHFGIPKIDPNAVMVPAP
jgi:hypothetical protein